MSITLHRYSATVPTLGGAVGVVAISGLSLIGLMATVNLMIASDFRWLILSFVVPWALVLALLLVLAMYRSEWSAS